MGASCCSGKQQPKNVQKRENLYKEPKKPLPASSQSIHTPTIQRMSLYSTNEELLPEFQQKSLENAYKDINLQFKKLIINMDLIDNIQKLPQKDIQYSNKLFQYTRQIKRNIDSLLQNDQKNKVKMMGQSEKRDDKYISQETLEGYEDIFKVNESVLTETLIVLGNSGSFQEYFPIISFNLLDIAQEFSNIKQKYYDKARQSIVSLPDSQFNSLKMQKRSSTESSSNQIIGAIAEI